MKKLKQATPNSIMGWEISQIQENSSLSTKIKLSKQEIRASILAIIALIVVAILSCWLASCPFKGAIRINSSAIIAKGWTLNNWGIAWEIILLAVIFEFLDSAAGMGYGTAFTPLLFIMGYEPMQIIPAIMIQQACAGLTSAYIHKEYGNVEWKINPMSETVKLWLIIAGAGAIAAIFSITSIYSILKIHKVWIKLYVCILLVAMGVISLIKIKKKNWQYSPQKMIFFGGLAGLNKGIGGGGYGPVITIGGLLSGIPIKSMIAITALSEGTVCTASILAWIFLLNNGLGIDFALLPSMILGSILAVIAAPYAIRILPERFWQKLIPIYCLLLASISFWKLWPALV